jgi:hypothetical protein
MTQTRLCLNKYRLNMRVHFVSQVLRLLQALSVWLPISNPDTQLNVTLQRRMALLAQHEQKNEKEKKATIWFFDDKDSINHLHDNFLKCLLILQELTKVSHPNYALLLGLRSSRKEAYKATESLKHQAAGRASTWLWLWSPSYVTSTIEGSSMHLSTCFLARQSFTVLHTTRMCNCTECQKHSVQVKKYSVQTISGQGTQYISPRYNFNIHSVE